MWFGSTELVNAEQNPLHFALPGPGDWEALVAREAAVRDFALGHSVIDIHTLESDRSIRRCAQHCAFVSGTAHCA